jgi:DNA mismatch repair ATPase MutS
MRDFEQRLDEDIAWLREKGLDDYADGIQQLREPPSTPEKLMQLGKTVGRLRQVRFLVEQQPEQGAKALQAMQLESRIARLSQQWQAAEKAGDAQARREAGAELRKLLEQQFDARLESTRALIESIKRRLEHHQAELKQQEQLRDRLIDSRFQELTEGGPSQESDGVLPKIGPEVPTWPPPSRGSPPSPDAPRTPDAP